MSLFSNGKGVVFLPHGQKKMKQRACKKCATEGNGYDKPDALFPMCEGGCKCACHKTP